MTKFEPGNPMPNPIADLLDEREREHDEEEARRTAERDRDRAERYDNAAIELVEVVVATFFASAGADYRKKIRTAVFKGVREIRSTPTYCFPVDVSVVQINLVRRSSVATPTLAARVACPCGKTLVRNMGSAEACGSIEELESLVKVAKRDALPPCHGFDGAAALPRS